MEYLTGIFFYMSVYMCRNIIGTQFPRPYLEDEMCTLYSSKYSKNSTLEVNSTKSPSIAVFSVISPH